MKKLILFISLLIFSLIFFGCSKDDDDFEIDDQIENVEEGSREESAIKNEEDKVFEESTSHVDTSYSESVDGDVKEVADLVRKGNYSQAIAIGKNASDLSTKYWIGIANYCKMLMDKQFSGSERAVFRNNAKDLLEEVAYDAKDSTLQARAHLWLSMLINLNNVDLKGKRQAMKSLHIIQTTKLKNSPVYNDSLLFSAIIYRQMGWYKQARHFLKKLKNATAEDNIVFDPEEGKHMSCEEASRVGLAKVHKICFADGVSDYETSDYDTTDTYSEPETTSVEETTTEPTIEETATEPTIEETTEPETDTTIEENYEDSSTDTMDTEEESSEDDYDDDYESL